MEASKKAARSNTAADHRAAAALHRIAAKEQIAAGDLVKAREHTRLGRNHDSMAVRAAKKEGGGAPQAPIPIPTPKAPVPAPAPLPKAPAPAPQPEPVTKVTPVTRAVATPDDLTALRGGITEKLLYNAGTEQMARETMAALNAYPDVIKVIKTRPARQIAFLKQNDSLLQAANHTDTRFQAWYSPPVESVVMLHKNSAQQFVGVGDIVHNVGFDEQTQVKRHVACLIHELGHHVEMSMIRRGNRRSTVMQVRVDSAWRMAEFTGKFMSQYARTNRAEYFAETWTAYHMYPDKLKTRDIDGYNLMKDVVNKYAKK